MPSHRSRQILAAMVAVALTAFGVPVSAADPATLLGRVYGADGATPRSGVVVALVDESGETIYDSAPTDDEGVFRVDGAPAGSYAVLARAPEGDFLAGGRVALGSGANPPVTLALLPTATPSEKEEGDADTDTKADTDAKADTDTKADTGAGGDTDDSQPPPPVAQPQEGLPTWAKGTLIGVISLGGLGLIYWLGEDEDLGSPF